MSLLAVEALVAEGRRVVLIDADTVGTEASEVLTDRTKYRRSKVSLVEIFNRVPDHESVGLWIEGALKPVLSFPRGAARRCVLIPTFGSVLEADRPAWREVLEQSGLYVQRRLRDLVRVCHAAGCDVVVDLPAFDVGLAKEARLALTAAGGTLFFVTDVDARSINATVNHYKTLRMSSAALPVWMVINRVPATHRDVHLEDDVTPPAFLVRVPVEPAVLDDTRHDGFGGRGSAGLSATLKQLYDSLADDDRRHLRGER